MNPLIGGSSSNEGPEVKDTERALIIGIGGTIHYHLSEVASQKRYIRNISQMT